MKNVNKNVYEKYWNPEINVVDDKNLPADHPYVPVRNFIKKVLSSYDNPNFKILDVGCGNGWASENLKGEKWGVDISESVLRMAKGRGLQTKVVDLNGKIPFKTNSFDLVLSIEVLEHVFDYRNLSSEISRVTKSGAHVVVAVPYHGLLKNIAICLNNFDQHFLYDYYHIRFFTVRSMSKLLNDSGLDIVEVKKFGRLPFFENLMVFICRKR